MAKKEKVIQNGYYRRAMIKLRNSGPLTAAKFEAELNLKDSMNSRVGPNFQAKIQNKS